MVLCFVLIVVFVMLMVGVVWLCKLLMARDASKYSALKSVRRVGMLVCCYLFSVGLVLLCMGFMMLCFNVYIFNM